MYYTVIKHSGHLRTLEKCRKHSPGARVVYISLVFSNACHVLSQCNTRLRLLYLLNIYIYIYIYIYICMYLRNRKYFPCFYQVIETRLEVWENEKCCGNTSRRRVFPQLSRVVPNLHECFYNLIETRKKCFLFLLENSPRKITKNEENLIVLFIIKT